MIYNSYFIIGQLLFLVYKLLIGGPPSLGHHGDGDPQVGPCQAGEDQEHPWHPHTLLQHAGQLGGKED